MNKIKIVDTWIDNKGCFMGRRGFYVDEDDRKFHYLDTLGSKPSNKQKFMVHIAYNDGTTKAKRVSKKDFILWNLKEKPSHKGENKNNG